MISSGFSLKTLLHGPLFSLMLQSAFLKHLIHWMCMYVCMHVHATICEDLRDNCWGWFFLTPFGTQESNSSCEAWHGASTTMSHLAITALFHNYFHLTYFLSVTLVKVHWSLICLIFLQLREFHFYFKPEEIGSEWTILSLSALKKSLILFPLGCLIFCEKPVVLTLTF